METLKKVSSIAKWENSNLQRMQSNQYTWSHPLILHPVDCLLSNLLKGGNGLINGTIKLKLTAVSSSNWPPHQRVEIIWQALRHHPSFFQDFFIWVSADYIHSLTKFHSKPIATAISFIIKPVIEWFAGHVKFFMHHSGINLKFTDRLDSF